MNNTILKITDLNFYYGKKQILNSISHEFEKNKVTAIIGQSGCGKSTLLKTINRIAEENSGRYTGTIHLEGQDILSISKENLRKKVSLVFQTPTVFPFSIEKNISQVLHYHYSLGNEDLKKETEKYLTMVGLYDSIKDKLNVSANTLSGGEKQRLAIARALCVNPCILMLDEPTSALDIKNTILIEDLIISLKDKYSIIIVTHNLLQAKRISDNIIFMDNGTIIETNSARDFFDNPKSDLSIEYVNYI
ncbi:MAG: phosphate ABC transporter ATP-binding protein [Lachnospirales bacterium]